MHDVSILLRIRFNGTFDLFFDHVLSKAVYIIKNKSLTIKKLPLNRINAICVKQIWPLGVFLTNMIYWDTLTMIINPTSRLQQMWTVYYFLF